MPRYGGGRESFDDQQRRLAEMQAKLESVIAKENAAEAAFEELGQSEERATSKRRTLTGARREGVEIAEREAAVAREEAQAVNINTEAIERNRVARERRAAAARREAIDINRAFRGAADPLFAAAHASGQTSQYGLRRELGIGGPRADKLRDALGMGVVPAPRAGGALAGAQTRVQAAESALVRADLELAEAQRAYAAAKRRGELPAAEAAAADRKAAQTQLAAARLELESAERSAASAAEVIAARKAAAVALAREAEASVVRGGGPGQALIPHPTQFQGGKYVPTRENVEPGIAQGLAATKQQAQLQAQLAAHEAQQQAASTAAGSSIAAQVKQQQLLTESREAAAAASAQMAARSALTATALRTEGVALSTVSQAMHKHGALTQEFILAAARGETTLKELGNQALVTAGKFGGWTAAATGLFAVAGAIQQVGHGAITASAGVHTISRVIDESTYTSDQAQQTFSDLAREFNVPMEVAVDAVYRMGQRFHEFPAAVEAARASLYSFKTGEVDVATSTENLLAIVNGFGLTSQDLSTVYDQINQAQNTFGIRIRDTEAGLAKAAGTYRNAGGDLNYLLALTTAIGRATNRSGQEIGTGIARGVNEIRKSVNQAKLEAQGVDVIPENFQKTLQNALKVAQNNPNADFQQIASGLFGNQYARLISPVLRDQKTLNDALKDTSPEASKASAQKELAKVLEQADERIKSVGIELQALGSALSRAGAFDLAGVFLEGLTDVLHMAVQIVEVFDKLPEPLRTALTVAGELALALKLLQRFGATERFAGGALGFLAKPEQQFAARARSGLRGARDAARDEQEQAGRRSYRVANAAQRAELIASQAESAAAQMRRAGFTEKEIEANLKLAQANATAEHLAQQAAASATEAAAARLIAAAADEEYAAAAKLSNKALAARVQADLIPVPAALPPSTKGLMGEQQLAQQNLAKAAARRELSTLGQAAEDGLMRYYASVGQTVQSVTRGQVRLGTVGRTLDRAARTGIGAAGRATSVVENAARRIGGLGGGLGKFAAALGPLDIAFAAYFVLDAIGSDLEETQKKLDTSAAEIQKTPQTAAGMQALRAKMKQRAERHAITNGEAWEDFTSLLNPINAFSAITGIGGYMSPSEQRESQRQQAQARSEELEWLKQNQKRQRGEGLAQTGLTYDQLSKNIDRDQEARKAGLISQREFDRRMVVHAKEAHFLYFPTADSIQKAMAAVADARRESGGEGYAASLKGLNAESLATQAQVIATRLKDFGGSPEQLQKLRQVYTAQVNKLSGSDSAEDIKKLSEARNFYFETVRNTVEAELQVALDTAGGEGGRAAAYTSAARATASQFLGRARQQLTANRERLASARRRAAEARAAFRAGPQYTNLGQLPGQDTGEDPFGLSFGVPGTSVDELRDEAVKDAKRVRRLRTARGKLHDELKAAIRANNIAQRLLAQAAFEDREEGRQIDLALAQSQTSDPVTAANEAVDTALKSLTDARASKGKDRDRRIKVAVTNLNNARKATGEAVKEQAEQAAADARELREARYNFLESQTTDPLRLAHLETQKARGNVAGTHGADRLNAKAELNKALQSERDARLASREGDIDFEREMGKITVEDAINRYRELLKIRTLTKQQRRDIQTKIHQLKSESESEASGFDLDVGSIRMPTLYDVRRAWDPIREKARESRHAIRAADIHSNVSHMYDARARVQAQINVTVNDKNAAGEVFSAIDRALGTSVRAQLRSRGMRG